VRWLVIQFSYEQKKTKEREKQKEGKKAGIEQKGVVMR
jgi:hypothetical protein